MTDWLAMLVWRIGDFFFPTGRRVTGASVATASPTRWMESLMSRFQCEPGDPDRM